MRQGVDHILLHGFCITAALYIVIGEIMLMHNKHTKTCKYYLNTNFETF